MTSPHRPRVLFVDDDAVTRSAVARALVQTFDVTQASDGVEAVELLQKHTFDAIVTDLEMPRMAGNELIAWLEANQPNVAKRVVVMTGGAKHPTQIAWLRAFDAARIVAKPASLGTLVRAIGDAIERGKT